VSFCLGIECQPRADSVFGSVFRNADAVSHELVEFQKVLGGFFVVAKASGLAVERYFLAETIRVVYEMALHAAIVSIVDVAVASSGLPSRQAVMNAAQLPPGVTFPGLMFSFSPSVASNRE
jgi:hypothetical protein